MTAELIAKTDQYEQMLTDALEMAEIAVPPTTPLGRAARETREMAHSYLEDGRLF